MSKIFPEDDQPTLFAGIDRLAKNGFLVRALRGVYVFPTARSRDGHLLEEIGTAFRRGEISYVSLESALSEYGAISQNPVDRITVMTTGRKGIYQTPYGVLDFTHTDRSYAQILDGTVDNWQTFPFCQIGNSMARSKACRGETRFWLTLTAWKMIKSSNFENLTKFAMEQSGRKYVQSTVEKELLQYDILFGLDQWKLLDKLSFQGGTALRMCYGAPRHSEDLVFCAGKLFLQRI